MSDWSELKRLAEAGMPKGECAVCQAPLMKKPHETWAKFEIRKVCSVPCANANRAAIKIGTRFGMLTVTKNAGVKSGLVHWSCLCDCGNEMTTTGSSLRLQHTISCGCARAHANKKRLTTHGLSKTHPLYATWSSMRDRCKNPANHAYKNYGGRGISVCARWDSFELFVEDLGDKPGPSYSIDRINNDGNYEPGNIRWATPLEQVRNRRVSK